MALKYRALAFVSALAVTIAAPAVSLATTAAQPSVPTVQAVLGYESGAEITRFSDVRRYFEALKTAAPTQVVIGEYGRTWEGRAPFWAAIGTPANIARLDQIRANARALADPRSTSPAQAASLINDQPVLVWMAYSVHGDEISPADAAMETARRLLDDPAASGWLANAVVVFVPSQNPDGRERFLNSFSAGRGLAPNPDPASAERDQPWPSGRFNHYLFDLNRDWLIQTQPETIGHSAQIRQWRPQVVVDSHEMGSDASFFFPPEAEPLNPLIWPRTLDNRALFGRHTASRFDEAGLDYFNRKVFDAFYPGYGDGWPAYLGAVSMTYEVGSARGLSARRTNGEVFTYADTVHAHLTASLATIETAANNRRRLLQDFYDFHRDGVAGRGAYVLSRAADPAAADRLAGILVRSGVEVGTARQNFSACGGSYRAGDYVIRMNQPQSRMAEVLLTRDVAVPAAFLAEQERRRARGLPDEIYDVTAWSLPLMFGVPSARCASAPGVAVDARGPELVQPVAIANPDAAYGFLVAPGSAQARLLPMALATGLKVRSADQPFTQNGRNWPAGTLVIPRAGQRDPLPALQELATATGAEIVGTDASWVDSGAGFGSDDVLPLRAPSVAIAWGDPIEPESAGAVRWMLEREFGYPVTAIRTTSLAQADLDRYQVLILPNGRGYEDILGEDGVKALRAWVEKGGTLVSLGSATRLLTDEDSNMLASRREDAVTRDEEEKKAASVNIASLTDYAAVLAASGHGPDSVAGVLARAHVDRDHWIGAGLPEQLNVLVRGADIYTPLKRGEGTNAVRFESSATLLASGQLWAENREQLAFKPVVMVNELGNGQMIAFTQDPTVRGYLEGLKGLFVNAVFKGPSHVRSNW